MVKDRNKGITEITYNHLNLPKKISFGSLGTIEYIYGADGSKLQKKVTEGSANKTVDYLGGFQYENGNMEFFPTAEGYVKVTETGSVGKVFSYVYNHTDHLGNIRLRYTRDPEEPGKVRILEENSYYPFGLKHEGYNGNHEIIINPGFPIPYPVKIISITPFDTDPYQYKYQGQERQDEFRLNWDSFKWRNYDYAIGRFMSVDPLTEEYHSWSPYAFSGNRVIDARELEGLEPHSVHKTLDDAATNFGEQYNGISIRSGREVGTIFYSMAGSNGDVIYSYSTPILGTAGFVNPQDAEPIPEKAVQVGDGHTHGNDSNKEEIIEKMGVKNAFQYGDNFPTTEGGDLDRSDESSKTNPNFEADYIVMPNGNLFKYTPTGKKGDARKTDVKRINSSSIPSDPNSSTRTNQVSPSISPDILPINVNEDNFKN